MTIKRVLYFVAAVLFVVAAVIGFGWLAPDKPRDAVEWYQGLLALGLAVGFLGHAA